MEIKLGDKVRDRVTGYTGIATSKTEFLNGCIQIEVTPKIKGVTISKPEEVMGLAIDEGQLERIGPGINNKPIKKTKTGGPMRIIPKKVY